LPSRLTFAVRLSRPVKRALSVPASNTRTAMR
jgi:hypothetical protein